MLNSEFIRTQIVYDAAPLGFPMRTPLALKLAAGSVTKLRLLGRNRNSFTEAEWYCCLVMLGLRQQLSSYNFQTVIIIMQF